MAFAGQNKGKIWVPGEGYRYPPTPKPVKPKPQPKCACGEEAWRWYTWSGYICEACFKIEMEERYGRK